MGEVLSFYEQMGKKKKQSLPGRGPLYVAVGVFAVWKGV